jgi:hypothetical protein
VGKGTALPTGVQAQLETEFKPKIKSRLLESNTGRLLVSGAEIGRPFLVSKSVPTDRVSALRAAFDATMKDPEFLADAEKQRLLIGPDNGAAVAKRIADIYASPPEVIARARDIAGD